jgi:hypothetical protein
MAADTPIENTPQGEYDEQVEPLEPEKPRRSLWTLLLVISAIVILILILLMLRGCASGATSPDAKGKEIVPVEGFDPMPGLVSIWIAKDTSTESVLQAAHVSSHAVLDLGDGRYIVTVSAGDEPRAVASLKQQKGVYDAGRVYERPAKSK